MSTGRILLSLAVIGVAAAAAVGTTAAFFSDEGTSENTSFAAGTLDLQLGDNNENFKDNVTQTWDASSMVPGGDSMEGTLDIKNNGSIDSDHLELEVSNDPDNKDGVKPMDHFLRITQLDFAGESLLQGAAGADIPEYTGPAVEDCDVIADGQTDRDNEYAAIQSAVDNASSGNLVCVRNGTYTESVSITTDNLTLASFNGPDNVTIVGEGEGTGSEPHAAVHVDDGSNPVRNVTVKGFGIRNPNGKFGVFAGTGTTNSNNDGIDGLVIQHNVIEDISTNSTGGSLTGGPAGIGIRGDYGTDGNPGIEIKSNTVKNVQTSSSVNAVGITLKSFTGDAGFGKDSSGNNVTDSSSKPATDTDISNNKITNIAGGGGSRTKGISVSGEFEDVLVGNNTIEGVTAPTGSDSNGLAITFTENGGSFSDNQYDIDSDGNGERIGPRNLEIKKNSIDQVAADSPSAVFIGGYEDLRGSGDAVVTSNNITDGAVSRILYNQSGFQHNDAHTLDATNNWWGDFDPSDQVQGKLDTSNFAYGPFIGLINGTDSNGNGFADLQDFEQQTIDNIKPSLATGDTESLEMDVQLDASTPNAYNGSNGSTGMTLTVKMNQHSSQ